MAIILAYGFITGSPSVWRTISFYSINLLAVKKGIGGDEASLLILSGGILVFISPGYLYDIAFQLFFGIVFETSLYKKAIEGYGNKAIRILSIGGISFLFSLPILLYNFQSAPIMTILATPIIQLIIFNIGTILSLPLLINIFIPLNIILNQI